MAGSPGRKEGISKLNLPQTARAHRASTGGRALVGVSVRQHRQRDGMRSSQLHDGASPVGFRRCGVEGVSFVGGSPEIWRNAESRRLIRAGSRKPHSLARWDVTEELLPSDQPREICCRRPHRSGPVEDRLCQQADVPRAVSSLRSRSDLNPAPEPRRRTRGAQNCPIEAQRHVA